jgi:DNA repair protein RadD
VKSERRSEAVVELRPYQAAAIDGARRALAGIEPGRRRSVLLVSPTGSGKTVIGSRIVESAVSRSRRALWCVHRRELVDQAYDTLKALGLNVGVVCASSSRRPNPYAPVQVASLDTLIARDLHPPADVVVFDEAHHAAAKGYAEWLAGYPSASVVGLTATPERSDGTGLGGLFSRMLVVTTPARCLADGHLVPMELVRPARPLKPGQIAQRPVDAWRQHAAGRQTIVFCASIDHASRVAVEFADAGVLASVISTNTETGGRRVALSEFRAGRLPVLCNVAVLTEGTDLPLTSCIILARGAGTPGIYLQMAGRGSRPSPGKSDCTLIDLRGVSHQHGHPYDSREYSLEGRGIRGIKDEATQGYCKTCGAPVESGLQCSECGVASGRDSTVTVTNTPLVKYEHLKNFTDDQRARMLATLLRKSSNPKQAFVIYSRMHGHWPPKAVRDQAQEMLAA